jgi:hypothetical protein
LSPAERFKAGDGAEAQYRLGQRREERPPATMPADFHYAPLPQPASDKPVALPLPIRVVCGSEEAVGDFVPDPNMVSGEVNHKDASVDVSVPHAAPLGVYQSERYAKDFAHSFAVPKGQQYLVRLHFAEIFDDGAGQRVENIEINGQPVLKDSIFSPPPAAWTKAVVKDFAHILNRPMPTGTSWCASIKGGPDFAARIRTPRSTALRFWRSRGQILIDFAEEPGAGVGPVIVGGALGDAQNLAASSIVMPTK